VTGDLNNLIDYEPRIVRLRRAGGRTAVTPVYQLRGPVDHLYRTIHVATHVATRRRADWGTMTTGTAPETQQAGGQRAAPRWRRVRGVAGRVSWGVADQAMGSFTNFLLSVYIARSLGAVQFGAFTLAYVTYGFAINASRGVSIEPLLIRFSGADTKAWRRAASQSTGTALLVGMVAGCLALVAGAALRNTTGLAFLALGLMLPGLMLQDSWRYAFFSIGRGRNAFINDSIWAAVQVPLLIIVKVTGHAGVFWFIVAWGAGAYAGAAIGSLQGHVVPSLRGSMQWLARHRDLGPRYLLENTGGNATDMARGYGASYILGLAAVGVIQAANVLMGPFKIIYFGMGMLTIPEASGILRRTPRRLALFCAVVSAGLSLLALAWGAVLLVALPLGLGKIMLGALWRPAYPLVQPTVLAITALCASTGASVGLHALGAARRSLRITLIGALALVACSLAGAVAWGTLGSVYGAALGSGLSAALLWWQFRSALRDADIPAPRWMWPR
jgi:O-antigen/teichoic acid export membrane protein